MQGVQPALRRPTITVACPTRHPGGLVRAVLDAVRGVADEILVAADARVDAADLAAYAHVADRVVRFEHIGANRQWSWLASEARGDWLLILDGDELLGAELIDALPGLVADRRIRQYSLPIRWPWPDPGTVLASEPWSSDRRLRLLRNDGRLEFAGRKHALAAPDPPIRFLDALPVYHLDLLVADHEHRLAKVQRSEREAFGLLTPEGLPFDRAFYLPESAGATAFDPVPLRDRAAIAGAVASAREPAPPSDQTGLADAAALPLRLASDVAWRWAGRSLPDDALAGSVAVDEPLPPFVAEGRRHPMWIRASNAGTALWPGMDRQPQVEVSVGFRASATSPLHIVDLIALPHEVAPGEHALIPAEVCGPPLPGRVELVVQLVAGVQRRAFGSQCVAALEVDESARAELDRTAAAHGGIVPLDDAARIRRRLARRDALAIDIAASAPAGREVGSATRAALGAMVYSSASPFSLTGPALDAIVDIVHRCQPRFVVEFGSGTSTVLLAVLMRNLHGDHRIRVVSVEEDAGFAESASAQVRAAGLEGMVRIVHAPLTRDGEGPGCYGMTPELRAALLACPPELILVDGPSLRSGASRLRTLELASPYLRHDAFVVLDDALRDAELTIAQAWADSAAVDVRGIRLVGHGLLEARLRRPRRMRWRGRGTPASAAGAAD